MWRSHWVRAAHLVVVLCAAPRTALAICPAGSYSTLDSYGNTVCKSFAGAIVTSDGSLSNCPMGSHPWVDAWGNHICQSFDANQRYYDTAHGCPIGTFPWVDEWGNRVCKSF